MKIHLLGSELLPVYLLRIILVLIYILFIFYNGVMDEFIVLQRVHLSSKTTDKP